jgi:hypothetical protein
LAFGRRSTTFGGETHPNEAARMSAFEIYAFFGSPLLLLLLVLGMAWLTGLQDSRDEEPRTPAE